MTFQLDSFQMRESNRIGNQAWGDWFCQPPIKRSQRHPTHLCKGCRPGLTMTHYEKHFVPIIHLKSEKQTLPKRMLHLSEQMGEPGCHRCTFISSNDGSWRMQFWTIPSRAGFWCQYPDFIQTNSPDFVRLSKWMQVQLRVWSILPHCCKSEYLRNSSRLKTVELIMIRNTEPYIDYYYKILSERCKIHSILGMCEV